MNTSEFSRSSESLQASPALARPVGGSHVHMMYAVLEDVVDQPSSGRMGYMPSWWHRPHSRSIVTPPCQATAGRCAG